MSETIQFGFKNAPIITGQIAFIGAIEKPTEKFTKQSIGIDCSFEYNGMMINKFIGVEIVNKQIDLHDNLQEGDIVRCVLDIGSTAVQQKKGTGESVIYNNIRATKIDVIVKAGVKTEAPKAEKAPSQEKESDDIPF